MEIEVLKKENADLKSTIIQLEKENKWFKDQLLLAQKKQFGSSSEKTPAMQLELGFNEAETVADSVAKLVESETVTYTRKPMVGRSEEVLEKCPTRLLNIVLRKKSRSALVRRSDA